ncbi:MAG: uroporphyrinogen decarboxylase family protein [Candidatus Krumholzibacteriota bacterium]
MKRPDNNISNRDRLVTILEGGVPDFPPHFEITFQLGKEFFDMDWQQVNEAPYASEAARTEALEDFHIELQLRLIEEFDYAAVQPPNSLAGIEKTKRAVGERALVAPHDWDGVFWMPGGNEIMQFVERMYLRPDEMHAEARTKCDAAKLRLAQQADAGADFFLLAYDFGFNNGPFISPTQFGEFVAPYLDEIVAAVHDTGKKALLHSDGDLNLLLDRIHATGIDGYQSVDPQGNMDIRAVRERFPDWILMGNVNSGMLQFTDEEKIRESVDYCMEHGGVGKRYVFSTSNCIFDGMPAGSYRMMLREYRKWATDPG